MAIGDIFKPKYKHSDLATRLEAVSALGGDDAELLAEIAGEDDDSQVRRLAVDKIDDLTTLTRLAQAEKDAELRAHLVDVAGGKWSSTAIIAADHSAGRQALVTLEALGATNALVQVALKATNGEIRHAALDLVRAPQQLGELARTADDPTIRTESLDRITDVAVLKAIAVDEQHKDVALAALERIADVDSIEGIASKAKSKAVRTRANRVLADLKRADDGMVSVEKMQHAERVQIVRVVEDAAAGHEWIESHSRVTKARAEWEALGDGDDAELRDRFQTACGKYFAGYERFGPPVPKVKERATPPPIPPPRPSPASDQVEGAPAAAQPLVAEAAAEPSVPEAANTDAQTSAADESQPAGADKTAAETQEEAEKSQPSATSEQREDNQKALEALIADLDSGLELEKLKTVEKRMRKVDTAFKKLGPVPGPVRSELLTRYENSRLKLKITVGEMQEAEEWKRWANVPKQQQLAAKAKELAEAPLDSSLSKQLKDLQTEWRNVGPAPRDKAQELLNEFKVSCDAAYERIKEFRALANVEKKDNLDKKTALCVEAEALSDSEDWVNTANALKKLQSDWKQIGPVPHRQSDAIWKRFRAACDAFFERRKPHLDQQLGERKDNLEAKTKLIAELEALSPAEGEPNWGHAIDRVKSARREWKNIGPVPQRDFRKLNDRFFKAADRVFDLRDQARDNALKGKIRIVEAAKSKLLELIAAEGEPDLAGIVEAASAMRASCKDLGPKGGEELAAAVEEATVKAVEAYGEAFKGTELDPEASRKRREKLCSRVEELIPAKSDEPAAASAEDMAAKLRAALADRALGGVLSKAPDPVVIERVVNEARESWVRLGPVPGEPGAALDVRFEAACDRALSYEG